MAAARAQAAGPAQAPSQEALARQLQALGSLPLDGAVVSQFLAGYQTGQLNTAGRPMLAVGPGWPRTPQILCRSLGRSIAVSLCSSDMTSAL